MSELATVRIEERRDGPADGAVEREHRVEEHRVSVAGEIDLSNARDVLDAITRAVPEEARRVVVDLGAVGYLDSAAISMLFRLAATLTRRRQELRLVVPDSSPVRAVLRLTSLDRVVPVVSGPDETPKSG